MRLQSDPTIIYGLVGGKGSLGRPIQRNEIEQPTPYNTYVIDGLPPGPIANPGRASLEAAANPARTKELFFVADGTGGHAFADNYEQHQKNVARLRAIEQQTAQPRARGAGRRRRRSPERHAAPRALGRVRLIVPNRPLGIDAAVVGARACEADHALDKVAAISRTRIRNTMALSSMTGFARGHGVAGAYAWAWELKSVNAKGLDLQLRLPPGWDAVEAPVRARAAEALSRGSVYANLTVSREGVGAGGAHQRAGARRGARDAARRSPARSTRAPPTPRRHPRAQGRDRGHRSRGEARRSAAPPRPRSSQASARR